MAPLRVSIPSAHTDSTDGGKDFTAYEIRIEHPFPRTATTLQKRYSDFAALDSALRSQVGTAPPSPLPPKSWLGGSLGKLGFGSTAGSPELVEKRRHGLEKYLQAIETDDDGRWRVAKAYRDFLDLGERDKKMANVPGSQFGKDRVRDSTDWLDKYSEVKSNLQDARKWLTKREQATAATAQHDAGANAKRGLVRAGTLLSALEEALSRLGGSGGGDDWSGERLGEGEIRRRRDLISTSRKERDGLESVLNTMAVKAAVSGSGSSVPSTSSAAVTNEQKAGLFSRANQPASGRRVLGAPAKETERTRELDNDGVLQLQKQIIAEQDQDLVDLTTVVRRMREMGVQINEEIVEQNAMLGLLDEDVERVDGKMKIAKKRIDKISDTTFRNTLNILLGINCRGSAFCSGCPGLLDIKKLIDTLPADRVINEGQQIACASCQFAEEGNGGICAFTQKMGGNIITAGWASGLMAMLVDHRCSVCGSVPVHPGNNVNEGELTVNWVKHSCGSKVCL